MADKLFRDADDLEPQHQPALTGASPGKSTLSSRLSSGRPTQIVFRVESAEAAQVFADRFGPRDTNGVAAAAHEHVDRAAASSGSALPGELRERFESSLGTDLSGVRIHTGSESQTAAKAVGAKAYTTGQDVHFGAGQYDPSSSEGMFLIAHEVAHTVQQAGAAPTRQHKLEVTSSGDAAEIEADRAAEAMVAGRSTSIGSRAASISRWQAPVIADEDNPGQYDRVQGGEGHVRPYEDVETDEKTVRWKEKTTGVDGQVYEIQKSGLNLYSSEARSHGITPDPSDPYGTPPDQVSCYDWTGIETPGPETPPAWGVSFAPKQPLPVCHTGDAHSAIDPGATNTVKLPLNDSQLAFAQSRVTSFRAAYDQGKSSWDAMSPNVKAFYEAGKSPDLKEGGLNLIQSQAEAKAHAGKNMSELTEAQKVGLKDGGGATTTVSEIAKLDDKQAGDLKSNLPEDKKAKLQALAGDVAAANSAVKVAYDAEKVAIAGHRAKGDRAKTAAKNIDLTRMKSDSEDEKTKLALAEAAKKEVEGQVDSAFKALDWGVKIFSKPLDVVEDVVKTIDIALYKHIVGADYDAQIKKATGRIRTLSGQIKKASSEVSLEELDSANAELDAAAGAMKVAKGKILEKLNAADQAYRTFAQQAGKQVGGKKGEQVQAALEALPKVALVVSYCDAVVAPISIPQFSFDIGIGLLGAASPPGAFVNHMELMGGYKTTFQKELTKWKEVQSKLQSIAKSYGLGD